MNSDNTKNDSRATAQGASASASDGKPVWLVTGCSSGLGLAIGTAALAQGYRVVLTARDPATLNALAGRYPETALHLALDVTDADSIKSAIAASFARFGRVDVLVNNAGYGYSASIEEGEDAVVRRMFEVNFFGVAALTRALLPHMRARRSGWIINITSIAGLQGMPGSGYYSAAKFAVEGFSEALAAEVEPLGLHVVAVAPGGFRTQFRVALQHPSKAIDDYAPTAGVRRTERSLTAPKPPGDPERAAAAIIAIVQSEKPPRHVVLGAKAVAGVREKLSLHIDELDAWTALSKSADFPDA